MREKNKVSGMAAPHAKKEQSRAKRAIQGNRAHALFSAAVQENMYVRRYKCGKKQAYFFHHLLSRNHGASCLDRSSLAQHQPSDYAAAAEC